MTTPQCLDSSHGPARSEPDATTTAAQLSGLEALPELKVRLKEGLRQYPDFPEPGILFEDVMPLFASPALHADLVRAYELQIAESLGTGNAPDIIVGLDARGFLFGPTLALRLGAGFVPVRKEGKLPGKVETVTYQKEYGKDSFSMQTDSIQPGQRVLVVDDLIATGGSAAAAGTLVRRCGGDLLGYIFIIELTSLRGRDRLDAPVYTLLESQES